MRRLQVRFCTRSDFTPFALHAFAPIVIASVAGAVVHQLVFGDFKEFNLPLSNSLSFYAEIPAFMILGLVCGLVAVV
jgi:CIC family chloride channel protein